MLYDANIIMCNFFIPSQSFLQQVFNFKLYQISYSSIRRFEANPGILNHGIGDQASFLLM